MVFFNTNYTTLFAAAISMCMAVSAQASTGSVTAESDNWMLTDALGRKASVYEEAGERNEERFVGLFYWTWHQGYDFNAGLDDTNVEVKNITEVLRQYPEAINNYNHPAWGEGAKRPGVFYWDEPIFGYYRTTDPWVLRKHAEMLADAGIDCIIMDCTNGSFVWEYSYKALLETWSQAQKDGVNVPKIAFILPFAATPDSKVSLNYLYNNLYSKGLYKDLWFYWKGKPLIMAYPDNLDVSGVELEIRTFFTFRPGQPDYVSGPKANSQQWGWLEVYPNHAFNVVNGKAEQCTVGVAQNARAASGGHCCAFNLPNTYGRSYSKLKGFDTRSNGYLYGWNFQEQWDRAINEIKPEFVFVTGWNEWTSGMWTSAHGWSDPLSFVDQFDWDHSRDCEPTKGWGDKGDVYYQQLVDNVRRFKGMAAPAEASEPKTIELGVAGQWDDVLPRYKAYKGNTFHRDHSGRYNKYYTDNTGRNDIVGAQVTHDAEYVYFRVETAATLSPSTDPAWMQLFIDVDRDKSTGWGGYDYVINRKSPENGEAYVEKCPGSKWIWMSRGRAKYVVNDNVLEIAVPKSLLNLGEKVDIEFKWNDNMQDHEVLDFYVSGDSAPGGRFNYRYTSEMTVSGISAVTSHNAIKAYPIGDTRVSVECDGDFTVSSLSGSTVARSCGNVTIELPAAGMYIFNSKGSAVKVFVR